MRFQHFFVRVSIIGRDTYGSSDIRGYRVQVYPPLATKCNQFNEKASDNGHVPSLGKLTFFAIQKCTLVYPLSALVSSGMYSQPFGIMIEPPDPALLHACENNHKILCWRLPDH